MASMLQSPNLLQPASQQPHHQHRQHHQRRPQLQHCPRAAAAHGAGPPSRQVLWLDSWGQRQPSQWLQAGSGNSARRGGLRAGAPGWIKMARPSPPPPPPPPPPRHTVVTGSLASDLPFAAAIGASIAYSAALSLPGLGAGKLLPSRRKVDYGRSEQISQQQQQQQGEGGFSLTELRYGAMTVISVIPLFNWLSWLFAWADSQQARYLVFATVYLAPYLRTGFSLSSDDSWLPLLSVAACCVHVQIDSLVDSAVGEDDGEGEGDSLDRQDAPFQKAIGESGSSGKGWADEVEAEDGRREASEAESIRCKLEEEEFRKWDEALKRKQQQQQQEQQPKS